MVGEEALTSEGHLDTPGRACPQHHPVPMTVRWLQTPKCTTGSSLRAHPHPLTLFPWQPQHHLLSRSVKRQAHTDTHCIVCPHLRTGIHTDIHIHTFLSHLQVDKCMESENHDYRHAQCTVFHPGWADR